MANTTTRMQRTIDWTKAGAYIVQGLSVVAFALPEISAQYPQVRWLGITSFVLASLFRASQYAGDAQRPIHSTILTIHDSVKTENPVKTEQP
jgi:hypothetical protein